MIVDDNATLDIRWNRDYIIQSPKAINDIITAL